MRNISQSFKLIRESLVDSNKIFKESKTIKILFLIPLFITFTLYMGFGYYLITRVSDYIRQLMIQWLGLPNIENFFSYLLFVIFSCGMFFIINSTLIISLSIISIPFNGLLAQKTKQILQNEVDNSQKKFSLKELFMLKKSSFTRAFIIAMCSLFLMAISIIPGLFLIVFPLTCLLFAINFLDYTWEEYQLSTSEIINNTKKNLLSYIFAGILCLLLASIPLVNIIVIPGAVIFFSVLYDKTQKYEST